MISQYKKILLVLLAGVLAFCVGFCVLTSIPKTVKADDNIISIQNTASVRTDDTRAIRFRTYVNTNYVEENAQNLQVVTIITPSRNITSPEDFKADFSGEHKKIVFSVTNGNLVTTDEYTVSTDANGNNVYNACIYNVQEQNIARDFSARSYLVLNNVVLEDSYTDIVSESIWTAAKRHLDNIPNLEEENPTEYANVSALCASHVATIKGFDNETFDVTVKRGQTVTAAVAESNIAEKLNVEGTAYYSTMGEDANVTLTQDAEFTAIMNKLEFTKVDGGYEVNAGNIMAIQPEKIIVPAKYNGEDVVSVASLTFSGDNGNSCIKYIKLPESVKLIKYQAFAQCTGLETLIMPGITGATWNMNLSTQGTTGIYTMINSNVLKHVVVGVGFKVNGLDGNGSPAFLNSNLTPPNADVAPADAENKYRTAELYYYGDTGSNVDVTNNTAFKVRTNARYSDCYYTYSKNEKVGCWHYDENYVPAVWEDKTVYELNDSSDGYILTHFAEKDVPADGKVIIDTYEGLPVVELAANAFGAYTSIKYLKIPNVTKVGKDAISKLSALETLIMTGVTGGTYSSQTFMSNVKSDVLKHVVVSGAFKINGFATTDARFTNSNLNPPAANQAAADQGNVYRTAEVYYVGTNSSGTYNSIDATNNTAFKFINSTDDVGRYSKCYYFYSETPAAGGWYYDENDIPTPYKGAAYTAVEGGYEVSMYIPSGETTIEIPETYEGQSVVSVAANAFGNNATVETLKLPESVTSMGSISGLTGLKTLIIPGITSAVGLNIKSKVLETITAGYGFKLTANLINDGATYLAKVYLVNMPENFTTSAVVQSDVLSKTSNTIDAVHLFQVSGEIYAYDAALDGYVLVNFYSYYKSTLIVPEKVNDGINGEKNVVMVNPFAGTTMQSGSYAYTNKVTTIVLPKTVTKIGYHAFVFNNGLTTLVMPGVTGDIWANGTGSDNLTKVVVGAGANITLNRNSNANADVYAACTAEEGTVTATGSQFSGNIYYFSKDRLSGAWTYDGGIPTLWDNIVE